MADSKGPASASVVTLVEQNSLRSASGRARLVFLAITAAGGVLGAIVLTPWLGPAWGLLLGGVVGFGLGVLVGLVVAIWPVLRVLWHWAMETTLVLLLVAISTWLTSLTAPIVASSALLGLVVVLVAVPEVRRWLRAWVWCAIVRHRLRLSFAAFLRSQNRIHVRGSQPLILLARPTPAGERVWVWLRPGMDLPTLEESTAKLAVACWAASVRVTGASPNRAALVRIDITRRDPLTGLIEAPLVGLIPSAPFPVDPFAEEPAGGLDLDSVPAEAVGPVVPLTRPRGAR